MGRATSRGGLREGCGVWGVGGYVRGKYSVCSGVLTQQLGLKVGMNGGILAYLFVILPSTDYLITAVRGTGYAMRHKLMHVSPLAPCNSLLFSLGHCNQ